MGEEYAHASDEFRMLLRGEFGRTPAQPNPEVVRKVLGEAEEPLRYRPASYLMPVLEEPVRLPFVRTHKDLLLHFLFREAADTFLKNRYALEEV